MDFAVPADHRIKLKESEKKGKYLEFARKLEMKMEHEGDNYTNCGLCFWYCHQRVINGTGGLVGWRTSKGHPNYNIIENGQKKPWKLEETCCHSNSTEKPSAKTDVKKLSMSK